MQNLVVHILLASMVYAICFGQLSGTEQISTYVPVTSAQSVGTLFTTVPAGSSFGMELGVSEAAGLSLTPTLVRRTGPRLQT